MEDKLILMLVALFVLIVGFWGLSENNSDDERND